MLYLTLITGLAMEIKRRVTKEINLSSSWSLTGHGDKYLGTLRKIQTNNINLVFIQFYTMQSLFKCLEEKNKKWKCRMTFAVEVNTVVDLSGLVLLGLSLQEHLSEDRHPLQRKGGIIKYTRAATSI